MIRNFFFIFMLGLVLGLATFLNGASAGECGKKPCNDKSPALVDRDSFGGQFLPPGLGKQRKRAQRQRIETDEPYERSYYSDDLFVQNDDERGQLIGPTEALTQALAVVPGGKALGVKLLKGPNPVYAVKLRVGGQVRRILVDARTAQVLGE